MPTPRAYLAPLLLALLAGCDDKSPPPAAQPSQPASAAPAASTKPKIDNSNVKKVSTRVPQGQTFKGLVMSTSLPYIIQLGKHGDLKIRDEGKANIIFDGEGTLGLDSICTGCEKSLRVQNFDTTTDTCLVQVDVGQGSDTTILGADFSDGSAPALVDAKNGRYLPVGFFYQDETKLIIRFEPGEIIEHVSQLPALSRSRPAQKLTLLYRVNAGQRVKYFAAGNNALVEFDPPVAVTQTNH